jgi:L-malate glycosyltransferase
MPAARTIRVLIVAPSTRMVGGQAQQAARLIERLRAVPGVEPHFLAIDPVLPRLFRWAPKVPGVRTLVNEAFYLGGLLRAVRRADLVHAFSASYYAYLLHPLPAMALARALGRPTILNYRSGEAEDHLANWRSAVPTIRRLASVIVAPSGYLVDVFGRFGLATRTIPNFVELDKIPYRERTAVAPRFLANRALEPLYNVPCIVRAFARIQAEVPDASLTIAGDGPLRATLEADVAARGLRNVRFAGRLSNPEMVALYDTHDVYLNAPNIDNMPGSLLECGAAGLPIVSTNAGGIPYIVTDNRTALLVERDDDGAMAVAALRVLREPGLAAALGRAGRAEAEQRYTWPVVAGQWMDLYRELTR